MYVYMHVNMYLHVFVHIYVHMYVHVYVHMYVHMYVQAGGPMEKWLVVVSRLKTKFSFWEEPQGRQSEPVLVLTGFSVAPANKENHFFLIGTTHRGASQSQHWL